VGALRSVRRGALGVGARNDGRYDRSRTEDRRRAGENQLVEDRHGRRKASCDAAILYVPDFVIQRRGGRHHHVCAALLPKGIRRGGVEPPKVNTSTAVKDVIHTSSAQSIFPTSQARRDRAGARRSCRTEGREPASHREMVGPRTSRQGVADQRIRGAMAPGAVQRPIRGGSRGDHASAAVDRE